MFLETEEFNRVDVRFNNPLISNILDFGIRVVMPWSGTTVEVKVRNTSDGRGWLFLTRRHDQLGAIYWERSVPLIDTSSSKFKIKVVEDESAVLVSVNGVEYPVQHPAIDFNFETFDDVVLFVNSENRHFSSNDVGFVQSPYVYVTSFQIRNDESVLIP